MYIFNSQDDVRKILNKIGQKLTEPADAVLYGGCAVMLMGKRGRDTDDLDLDCRSNTQLLTVAEQVAKEANVIADLTYTVEEFLAVSESLLEPHKRYGQFGLLTVYLCDPAIIAASKLDRRNVKDLEDIRWLLSKGILPHERFRACVEACREYDDRGKALNAMRELLGEAVLDGERDVATTRKLQIGRTKWMWILIAIFLVIALLALLRLLRLL